MLLQLILLVSVLAQDQLDAYVKILDNNDLAGTTGVYRFTVFVDSATVIRTFLPQQTQIANQQLGICRYYQVSATTPI